MTRQAMIVGCYSPSVIDELWRRACITSEDKLNIEHHGKEIDSGRIVKIPLQKSDKKLVFAKDSYQGILAFNELHRSGKEPFEGILLNDPIQPLDGISEKDLGERLIRDLEFTPLIMLNREDYSNPKMYEWIKNRIRFSAESVTRYFRMYGYSGPVAFMSTRTEWDESDLRFEKEMHGKLFDFWKVDNAWKYVWDEIEKSGENLYNFISKTQAQQPE